jgi:hypothetical protein
LRLKPSRNLAEPFEPKPGKPDQLFARTEPARVCRSGRFLDVGVHVAANSTTKSVAITFGPYRVSRLKPSPSPWLWLKSGGDEPRGIAVIQCRFYDLTAFIATPFSDAGKSPAAAETQDKNGWLTLSGYQSLSVIEA